jgi:nucleoside 2-deoxyribosyltransferase
MNNQLKLKLKKRWDLRNPTIYAAGKIWHAETFKRLRKHFKINSRWIDYDDDHWIVKTRKDILWQQCLEDSTTCDIMVIYCDKMDESQRGVLVELGQALAAGKFVYLVNTCKTFEACGTSDVAFTQHENFIRIRKPGRKYSARIGFQLAIIDWRERHQNGKTENAQIN